MASKDLNLWIMYYEIQKLSLLGFSNRRIAQYLGVDRRTVGKYLGMDEGAFQAYLLICEVRHKKLSPYKDFVKEKLLQYPDTSSAQVFDWLKERYPDLPEVSSRTVYGFVIYVRQIYNIPLERTERDYFPVEELPYGQQAQVDFGQYNMRTPGGKRVKVWFFAMVLSRSRMKYVLFSQKPFTAETVCQAHEFAFAFFGGIPLVVVYDQDRILIVDENLGKIILTAAFGTYVKGRGFRIHFCRKADPESKGKVENVIKYIKINFLTNRAYSDLETLNAQASAWLDRTANYLSHNTTKKSPMAEHTIEKSYLQPYYPLELQPGSSEAAPTYLVRKNNVVHYKGNFYSVPQGTYKGPDTYASIEEADGNIEIYLPKDSLICTHELSLEKGKTIINTNHKRHNSHSLNQMEEMVIGYFKNPSMIKAYLQEIHRCYVRYYRDHLQLLLKTLKNNPIEVAEKALAFCIKNKLYDALDFEKVASVFFLEQHQSEVKEPSAVIKPLYSASMDKASETPEKSNLDNYEEIINS